MYVNIGFFSLSLPLAVITPLCSSACVADGSGASVGLLGFSRVAVAGFERVGFELEAREEVREEGDVDLLRMLLRDLRLRERGEEAEGGGRGDEDDAAREEGEHYGY